MRLVLILCTTCLVTQAQIPTLSSNAPVDKPISTSGYDQLQKFIHDTAPFVEKAKATYPEAKRRFLAGLPKGEVFSLTYRLQDPGKRGFEQAFVFVKTIRDGKVAGYIASELDTVKTFTRGQLVLFDESDMVDWTISKPDGTEEGNYVGKYLDTLQVAK